MDRTIDARESVVISFHVRLERVFNEVMYLNVALSLRRMRHSDEVQRENKTGKYQLLSSISVAQAT